MDWIANMYGPTFLVLYAGVGTVLLLVIALWNRIPVDAQSPRGFALPNDNDPYRLAYLRGSAGEMIRLAVYRLLQTGHVFATAHKKASRVSPPQVGAPPAVSNALSGDYLVQAAPPPSSLHALYPAEQALWNALPSPRKAGALFSDAQLMARLGGVGQRYQAELENAGLLASAAMRNAIALRAFVGLSLTLALGGYKFFAALAKGKHNVGFLVLLSLVFLIAFGVMAVSGRITPAGARYLADLKSRYASLQSPTRFANADSELAAFGVALFGITVLTGTPQAPILGLFPQASSSGGCGSTGSCGSSCGGGGCGGGGCGGCGGG